MLVVALYNGYALVESDTGAYIENGIRNIIPNDRSPFYGWFIRFTSLQSTLWLSLFAQSLLLSWLLIRYIHFFQSGGPRQFVLSLFAIITIVSFTCVPWVVCYVMPDVFGGILLLAILLYLEERPGNLVPLIAYTLIIFLAIIIHNSHFLITGIFAFALIIRSLVKRDKVILRRGVALLLLSGVGWFLISMINFANGNGFTFSRGRHVFMVTKLAETGILKTYLNDNCGKEELKLCKYADQIPYYSWDFLWGDASPLYKTGGWDSNKVEYDHIIHGVFTTPKYIKMFAVNAATSTLRELCQVQASEHTSFQGIWSSPGKRIGIYFPDELNEYCNSRQCNVGVSAIDNNYFYYLFFVLSTLWLLFHARSIDRKYFFIYGCIFLFFLINAFVTATFSTVINRFQNRIFWLLPATNAILIITYYQGKFHNEEIACRKK